MLKIFFEKTFMVQTLHLCLKNSEITIQSAVMTLREKMVVYAIMVLCEVTVLYATMVVYKVMIFYEVTVL